MNCINHPDRPRIAFCQNCGKPLCSECARVVGSAVFDEACLAERLAASGTPPATGPVSYPPPVPPAPGAPNPVLAGVLGFIPGVGAMYNGQYAKGIVHLIVFAVLVSLADRNGVFGLFVAGWMFYQVFEAYHTAKARRDGTPLPNPFGLNDLGERLGFGKAWPATHPSAAAPVSSYAPDVAAYTAPGSSAAGTPADVPYGSYGASYAPPAPGASWSNPADSSPYTAVPPVAPAPPDFRPSRFPVGAVVLIGLGVLFLIGNAGWIEGFPVYRLFPFLLLGLGVWLFARRMLESGPGLADDGTPQYRFRLLRALRGSIWIFVVGLLAFLDSFNILGWGRSWPLFIVAAGVMAFLQRSAALSAGAAMPYTPAPVSPVPPSSPSPASSTSIVPVEPVTRTEEEV